MRGPDGTKELRASMRDENEIQAAEPDLSTLWIVAEEQEQAQADPATRDGAEHHAELVKERAQTTARHRKFGLEGSH